MEVLGLNGSLRPGSYNGMLLAAAARRLPHGARLEVWEGLDALPAYAEHLDGERAPAAARSLRAAIARADRVLVATPEYNGSLPGGLKNALDWASRPYPRNALRGKHVAVVGASTGLFGAVWAQADARRVLATIGARVVDLELPVGQAHDAFDADGELRDGELAAGLDAVVAALSAGGASPRRRAPGAPPGERAA